MAAIAIVRELWRFRRLVLVGVLVAVAVQLLILYQVTPGVPPELQSRQYEVGVASGAVLVDSQSSQAVDLGTAEVEVDVGSLAARAKLLANLLVTRPLRDEIAADAGVAPDRVLTELSSTTEPAETTSETDGTVQREDRDAHIISVQTNESVPIITVNTQAPTEKTASRLAESAMENLHRYLESVAASNRVPDIRKLVSRQLGEPTSATSLRGPAKSRAVAVFVLLVLLWCGAILVLSAVSKAWRYSVADERWMQAGAKEDPIAGFTGQLLADREDEASAAPLPLDVAEGDDDDTQAPPAPDTTSRVA